MPVCVRCNTDVPTLQSLFSFNKQTSRCKSCEDQVKIILNDTRKTFIVTMQQAYLTQQLLDQLLQVPLAQRIHRAEVMNFLQPDGVQLLSNMLNTFACQAQFDDTMERYFLTTQCLLGIPNTALPAQLRQISLLNLKRGKFFIIPHTHLQDIRLESDELCYLVVEAKLCKQNKSGAKVQPGRLVATNKKLRFLSPEGGIESNWNIIMSVRQQQQQFILNPKQSMQPITSHGVYIELTKKSGNGFYAVHDPEFIATLIDVQVRIAKRQLVAQNSGSRSIPQDIRIIVWQRDQAKCVQCAATEYLEYDHIIPFSKGGATSVNNLQLLCRKCNLVKSDRI